MSQRLEHIQSFDDSRLAIYRNLKDRELAVRGGRFVAEGEHVVKRLLASEINVESVLLSTKRVQEFAPLVPEGVRVFVVPHEALQEITGVKFHAGILACGIRPAPLAVEEMLKRLPARATLVVCPNIHNVDNIGSLIRISAGFGIDAIVLGEHCHDPFFRQSVRVSMGTIFKMPLVRSENIRTDLQRLKDGGIELIATVLDEDAEPLSAVNRSDRIAILLGNEAQGLERDIVQLCQRKVTIPMNLGTDSLNVAVAGGIFLYELTK